MERVRAKFGPVSRPTPTVKVWGTPGNEAMAHPLAGALRQGKGSSWPHDAFTLRRLQAGEITTVPPDGDLGHQREAIINEKLARETGED